MNYTPAQAHVSRAERNNRVIGERIRATFHHLPYQAMPKLMIRHITMNSVHQLNFFQQKMVFQLTSVHI